MAGPSSQNGQTRVVTEHHSKKIGEQNFDTRNQGVSGMAPSPPPRPAPLPVITLLPLVPPLLFCWLLHFPVPQPLPLVAPLPGASASTIHRTSTFRRAPLVWFVVTLPGASTPPPALSSWLHPVLPLVAPLLFGCLVALPSTSAYRTDGCHVATRHCLMCVYASRL